MTIFCQVSRPKSAGLDAFLLVRVTTEETGRTEFTELVPDHVLGAIHLGESTTVVNLEGHADEFRNDGAVTRPRADRAAVATLGLHLNLAEELFVDVWTLFERP